MADGFDTHEVMEYVRVLERADAKVISLCQVAVTKIAKDTVAHAQTLAPVDTGNPKNSIGADIDQDRLGFVAGPTASYGAAVEFGSRPHVIRPHNPKGALRFETGEGDIVFAKKVNHPGTAPRPYMRPAFDRAVATFDQVIDKIMMDVF